MSRSLTRINLVFNLGPPLCSAFSSAIMSVAAAREDLLPPAASPLCGILRVDMWSTANKAFWEPLCAIFGQDELAGNRTNESGGLSG